MGKGGSRMTRTPLIICDFDGTVTMNDNIVSMMKEFAPPEWLELKDGVLSKSISIQEGVGRMFGLLAERLKRRTDRLYSEGCENTGRLFGFCLVCPVKRSPVLYRKRGMDFLCIRFWKGS